MKLYLLKRNHHEGQTIYGVFENEELALQRIVLVALLLVGALAGYAVVELSLPDEPAGSKYFLLPTGDYGGKVWELVDNQCTEFIKDQNGNDKGCKELMVVLS